MCITVSKRPTEKTISKWISSRARRMGFKRHDIEDVQQQILLVLMDFEFNPEKSNGASGQTASSSCRAWILNMSCSIFKSLRRRIVVEPTSSTASIASKTSSA